MVVLRLGNSQEDYMSLKTVGTKVTLGDGRSATVVENRGNGTAWLRDSSGNLTSVNDSTGRSSTGSYKDHVKE